MSKIFLGVIVVLLSITGFLYYQNQYSYLKAARAEARVIRYVGIAFIIFFMELIWLSI